MIIQMFGQSTNQNQVVATLLDGINGWSIQTLLRAQKNSKQLHEIQAIHCDLYNDSKKTLIFIKINNRNTLFTNYNIHDKDCFPLNNTDSHNSRLTANFVFQAFER